MVFQFLKTGYSRLKEALKKARDFFSNSLRTLFQGNIDEKMLEKLEELLYRADFGVKMAADLTQFVRDLHRKHPQESGEFYLHALQQHLLSELQKVPSALTIHPSSETPTVILIVGVNGNGKTTSVAKLAHLLHREGKTVLVGAADTFRAAATEQLEIWSKRAGFELVKGSAKSDPAAVTFDAVRAAKARGKGVVLIDTAGRLHTKVPLMHELSKVRRACDKVSPGSPHETLLVLDATVGQNAIEQAKQFHQFVPLTGLILTKLDGTAKGGIVVAIQKELGIPIKFIGVGETLEDLEPFEAENFIKGLFEGSAG